MKRVAAVALIVIVLGLAGGFLAYVQWGYEGPTESYTVVGKGQARLVEDARGNPAVVRKDEIMTSPGWLARLTGKVRPVAVYEEDRGKVRRYVWKRSLPPDWDGDFDP